jgi:uncharacterized protein VirK/YbjX
MALALSLSSAFCQTLTLKWKSDATLPVSESVAFDSKNNVLYVSCIDGKPEEIFETIVRYCTRQLKPSSPPASPAA